jgi:hypothetical protein
LANSEYSHSEYGQLHTDEMADYSKSSFYSQLQYIKKLSALTAYKEPPARAAFVANCNNINKGYLQLQHISNPSKSSYNSQLQQHKKGYLQLTAYKEPPARAAFIANCNNIKRLPATSTRTTATCQQHIS